MFPVSLDEVNPFLLCAGDLKDGTGEGVFGFSYELGAINLCLPRFALEDHTPVLSSQSIQSILPGLIGVEVRIEVPQGELITVKPVFIEQELALHTNLWWDSWRKEGHDFYWIFQGLQYLFGLGGQRELG